MVAREVVGFEEEPNTSAGLVADPGGLLRSIGLGEQQSGAAARRRDHDPAFAIPHIRVGGERNRSWPQ